MKFRVFFIVSTLSLLCCWNSVFSMKLLDLFSCGMRKKKKVKSLCELVMRKKKRWLHDSKKFNFVAFAKKFKKHKQYKKLLGEDEIAYYKKSINYKELMCTMYACIETVRKKMFAKDHYWVANSCPDLFVKNICQDRVFYSPIFFVQKMVVKPGAKIVIVGDRHGDIHSLNKFFSEQIQKKYIDEELKIIKQDIYFVFLGDYVDRGCNGCELLYVLAQFKMKNPHRVVLLRGNHEDFDMNGEYGFIEELRSKYKCERGLFSAIREFYDFLPVALYIGAGEGEKRYFNLCCHAGIEIGFDPTNILKDPRCFVFQKIRLLGTAWLGPLDKLNLGSFEMDKYRRSFIPKHIYQFGFVWYDFDLYANIPKIRSKQKRPSACVYDEKIMDSCFRKIEEEPCVRQALNKDITLHVLKKSGVMCVFRGHQHSGDMIKAMVKHGGIYNLWAQWGNEAEREQWDGKEKKLKLSEYGPVWTINVSPDSLYGKEFNYTYDVYVTLILGETFDECQLEPCKIEVLD